MNRLSCIYALLLCLALAGCSPEVSRRRSALPSSTPQRIVSIAPSVTEILFAVGAGDRLVATDDYSNYPPEAKTKPHVGGIVMNYERIVGLKPDLVIGVADLQGPALDRLRKLGLNVLAIDTISYEKTAAAIIEVGWAVGEPERGHEVAKALTVVRDDVARRYAGKAGTSVLAVAEASPAVIVMGRGTFMDDLIGLACGRNAARVQGFGAVSRETLASLKPDILLVGSDEEGKAMSTRYRSLPGPDPRIVRMPEDILVRPGPRLGEGLAWLAKTVHEEKGPSR